jgi:protein gp37
MGTKTGISWTDSTWNPIRGCSRVSEGCRNCYAESVAYRFSGERLDGKPSPFAGLVQREPDGMRLPKWNGKIKFVEEHLLDPLKWKPILTGIRQGEGVLRQKKHRDGTVTVTRERSRRIFVNSMSDLFHENVTDEMRDGIFAVMALSPQHTFQVLTKRPERMLAYLSDCPDDRRYSKSVTNPRAWNVWCEATKIQAVAKGPIPGPFGWTTFDDVDTVKPWPLPNVQLGVSVENQPTADERIPILLETPAAVRFVSGEPLLGSLNIRPYLGIECVHEDSYSEDDTNATICRQCEDTQTLDWVIVGGESGPGARPMHPDWARGLRDQCKAAGVPFFFKQWGEWSPQMQAYNCTAGRALRSDHHKWDSEGDCRVSFKVGTKAAGCLLDGVEHHEFPGVSV